MVDTATVHAVLAGELRRYFGRRAPPQLVDDLVQETFLRVHTGLSRLRDPDRIAPWVMRIARSVLADGLRREGRFVASEPDPAAPAFEPGVDPDAIVAAWLPGMVEALPATYREAVRLSELDGCTQAEVARRLGLSPSGARTRVQRGRRLLREMLESCCEIAREAGAVLDWTPRAPCGCAAGSRSEPGQRLTADDSCPGAAGAAG
jgi:RNA polymerase sigma-70 factor (ECF subfamily)